MIDIHAYWEGRGTRIDEVLEIARCHGVTKVIFSPPAEIGGTLKPEGLYTLQRFMLRSTTFATVARLIAASFYKESGELRSMWRLLTIRGAHYQKMMKPDNDGLALAVKGHRNAFRWYWINPHMIRSPQRSLMPKKDVTDRRLAGIKIHAYWHGLQPSQLNAGLQFAERHKLPMYLHLGYSGMDWIVHMLHDHPTVFVILACGGFPHFDRLWGKIRPLKNIAIDLASSHIDREGIKTAARILGPSRCLFATDSPYRPLGWTTADFYREQVTRMQDTFPKTIDRRRVSFLNAKKFIPRLSNT